MDVVSSDFFFSSRRRHTRYWRDWSSDVCSSDLRAAPRHGGGSGMKVHELRPADGATRDRRRVGRGIGGKGGKTAGRGTRSGERRVGEEGRSRGSPYHYKKNTTNINRIAGVTHDN